MKYIIFGTGDYYERYKKWFDKDEVVALLDNSELKQGTNIDGIPVLAPKEVMRLEYDIIVILSFYVKSMKNQLVNLGVDEKCIYHFFDLHKLYKNKDKYRTVNYYANALNIINNTKLETKKILLLSHDLTLGGPTLALFHVAKALLKHNYQIVFASMLDGPLRDQLLENKIPVVVDENLQVRTMIQTEWTTHFDLILCNTISYYVFLSERVVEIPMIWWLHDSLFFYDGVDKSVLKNIDRSNLDIVSVGPMPSSAFNTYLPQVLIEELLYGVDDVGCLYEHSEITGCNDVVRFSTIGYIENRKGQDILIAAIKTLSPEILQKCEFYLIGQNTSSMAQTIKTEIEETPQVIMTGTVGRNEINQLLEKTDMLICPSREDPMPTVAAEAMMHSVPCILSDATGTASYIQDGEDGFVFKRENISELAEKITWCVNHKSELITMGAKARKIYENVFSTNAFEKRLMEIVEKAIC